MKALCSCRSTRRPRHQRAQPRQHTADTRETDNATYRLFVDGRIGAAVPFLEYVGTSGSNVPGRSDGSGGLFRDPSQHVGEIMRRVPSVIGILGQELRHKPVQ